MKQEVIHLVANSRTREIIYSSKSERKTFEFLKRKEQEAYALANEQLMYGDPSTELLEERELRELQFIASGYGLFDYKYVLADLSKDEISFTDDEGEVVVLNKGLIRQQLREDEAREQRKSRRI